MQYENRDACVVSGWGMDYDQCQAYGYCTERRWEEAGEPFTGLCYYPSGSNELQCNDSPAYSQIKYQCYMETNVPHTDPPEVPPTVPVEVPPCNAYEQCPKSYTCTLL